MKLKKKRKAVRKSERKKVENEEGMERKGRKYQNDPHTAAREMCT